jgi:hypothetical protein
MNIKETRLAFEHRSDTYPAHVLETELDICISRT